MDQILSEDCPECGAVNYVNNGDTSDTTAEDVDGCECWKCGHEWLFEGAEAWATVETGKIMPGAASVDLSRAKPEDFPPFEPHARYVAEGECWEFVLSPESFVAERLDGRLTVYVGRETGEVVGGLVYGPPRKPGKANGEGG